MSGPSNTGIQPILKNIIKKNPTRDSYVTMHHECMNMYSDHIAVCCLKMNDRGTAFCRTVDILNFHKQFSLS